MNLCRLASDLFVGNGPVLLIERLPDQSCHYRRYIVEVLPQRTEDLAWKRNRPLLASERSVTPYFAWAKAHLRNKHYIVSDELNHQTSETFVYNLWSDVEKPATSQAFLFKKFPVRAILAG